MPVKQGIAVTGSVNQKGEIQPIGGVNQKVEGFFGVIVPHQNVKNLMLRDDVVEAVKEGKFHIYAVKSIDEGIEILTGVPAGDQESGDGSYPEGTVNYLVDRSLSRGPHHQDSGEAKIRESTAGVSRKPSSDCKACGCSSKHLCGLTAWNT